MTDALQNSVFDCTTALLKEFPHPVDWIFRMIVPGEPDGPVMAISDLSPHAPCRACIAALLFDDSRLAKQACQSFLFQSALSVCSSGGSAVYFVKGKLVDLPVSVLNMPFPDITGLKKLKMVYQATSKELVRCLAEISHKPSSWPVLFCVEDLTTFCEATSKQQSWTIQRSLAALLSHFEEAVRFSESHKLPFRILFTMSGNPHQRDIVRLLEGQFSSLEVCSVSVEGMNEEEITVQAPVPCSVPWYTLRMTESGICRITNISAEEAAMN